MNPLLVQSEGNIETWTLNRPESRNPITEADMIEAITENVERVNQDHRVRAVILTGAGKAFSAGGNIKAMVGKEGMFAGNPYELRNGYRSGVQKIPLALFNCDVPTIAAINGPAVGAGADLAMMCDLRVMASSAWMAESFAALGIVPGDGGAWLLTKNLSLARAAEMALTGDRITAERALDWGLVNELADPEQLGEVAHKLAARVAKNPPHSVRMTKKLLRESQQQSLASILELSAAMQAIAHHTDDHPEAMGAFLNKREGRFTGR